MLKQSLWQYLIDTLRRHQRAALMVVVASKGSSPGTAGAKMALSPDGTTVGTIGGGRVEFDLSELTRELLNNMDGSALRLFNRYHNEHKTDKSGHICGGFQQVVLWLCGPDDLPLLEQLKKRVSEGLPTQLSVNAQGVEISDSLQQIAQPVFNYQDEEDWCYREMTGLRKQAYIIGGGHVGLALSQLLNLLDFEISIFDERDQVATMLENSYALDKTVASYQTIDQLIPEGDNSYIFIMTHSHETDQLVVERLAGKNYRYFGLMGSRRKINIIKQNLAESIPSEQWDNIHAPLGLPIKSRTPMEIAVSIAAELIQFENA